MPVPFSDRISIIRRFYIRRMLEKLNEENLEGMIVKPPPFPLTVEELEEQIRSLSPAQLELMEEENAKLYHDNQ